MLIGWNLSANIACCDFARRSSDDVTAHPRTEPMKRPSFCSSISHARLFITVSPTWGIDWSSVSRGTL